MALAERVLRRGRGVVAAAAAAACATATFAVDIADFVAPRAAPPPAVVAAPPAVPDAGLPAVPAERPVSLWVEWGGGKPQAWSGTIAVVARGGTQAGGEACDWRTLSTEPDAAAMAHSVGGIIHVHERRPLSGEGIEITVPAWTGRRIVITLQPVGTAQPLVTLDVPLEEALVTPVQKPLDGEGNRITVRQSPGDALRTQLVAVAGEPVSQVCRPGQKVRIAVDPLLPVSSGQIPVELRLRLETGASREAAVSQDTLLVPLADVQSAAAGRRPVPYQPVVFDVALPAAEGVYDVALEAVERGSLRWARPVASRRLQLVALGDAVQPPRAAHDGTWQLLHEVDPGSPRLHERLRRLPGVGLPSVSLPSVPLPAMPLPSFTRPSLPVPEVPVPRLPGVSIPSMATMVPRFNGLLAHGHSRVGPHPLGPVFRLPPTDGGPPTWEGIVVANAQPGLPHAVEVEYPTDQVATVAASVFELDAGAAAVVQRHAGGFTVRAESYVTPPPRMAVHRFVFWPTTKTPLVVLANPSSATPAAFGRVRVLVGPARLPAPPEPAGLATAAGRRGRRPVYGIVRSPRLTGDGGSERTHAGRSVADWATHVAGMEHEAERLVARGAAGALVTVFAEGAAAWPTAHTRHAPRWTPEATAESTVDATPKDLLAALCRVHQRAGLRLVPALEFDAPLPALEALVAQGGGAAVGVVCLGRDGKPAPGAAGPRYNVLDPRVQDVVAAVVREAAERVRGAECVGGLGLVLADDGWLHLPGPDWALDDATFGRFLASVGASEPTAAHEDRFARRAEAVQGPLRDVWLEWRAEEIAAFHARLADEVVAVDGRFVLHVVPTSLFAAGAVAARFQPVLGGEHRDAELLREIGLDPLRSTRHRAVVFGMPHVHAAGDGLRERGVLTSANRSSGLVQACAAAARRSLVLVEQPLEIDLAGVFPHAPFGAVAAPDLIAGRALATGVERDRRLAEAMVAGDAEIVFDETLLFETPAAGDGETARHAYEVLPASVLQAGGGIAAPLVVRSTRAAGATWVHVTNVAAAPADAVLEFDGPVGAVVDAATLAPLPTSAATVAVALPAWGARTFVVDGQVAPRSGTSRYAPEITDAIVARVASLRSRRAQLESPAALGVLDNPGFEMGGAAPGVRDAVTGWELVESRRGSLQLVAAGDGAGQAVTFSSTNGLATLRSNPFAPPATGRVSIAARLRIADGDPQPPLRIALEGVHDDGEFYRFATVGGVGGGRPLGTEWSLFVLQVDDLPVSDVDALRVRFDLLGPGGVQIDDVRVFDLAFDERQRVQLSRSLGLLEQRIRAGDLGGCLADLEGYWPAFLETFVPEVAAVAAEPPARQTPPPQQRTGSVFDRLKGWWQ